MRIVEREPCRGRCVLPSGMERDTRPGRIVVTTWHLEMRSPPSHACSPLPEGARVEPVPEIPVGYYRYLYETVGGPWSWVDRRWMGDAELASHVHDPAVEVHVASMRGAPAGYFELDARKEGEVELAYFGLTPAWVGRGLGRPVLERAIERAFALGQARGSLARIWVHTCSLDHPRARGAYVRAGFVEYEAHDHEEWDPRPLPVHPR